MSEEKFNFQTEAAELLKLMVNSVYSNRDIFLRELISNASDALDKRRIEILKNPELAENTNPEIKIEADPDKKIISVSDNGIGMSRDDLVNFLGTIAKSGTKEFLHALEEAKNTGDKNLIGQFGVGFYSVFMVADKVEVVSRKLGTDTTCEFISDGGSEFIIKTDVEQRNECGTTITLYLRDDSNLKNYADEWVIREIVSKYSDFISWPVIFKDKAINSQKAIWQKSESETTEDEYNEFYKHVARDWQNPLIHIRINAEGSTNFKGLLFVPSFAPFDLFMNPESGGISLYINRVFIMNDCKYLIPSYMRFIRGVIDSEDLPLNISREILQEEPVIKVIQRSTQRKIFNELKKLLETDREKYIKFWQAFGRVFKEGVIQDNEHAKNILEIALFKTTDNDGWTTIEEYKARMKEPRPEIYCLAGSDDISILKASPKLEQFANKNIEVLLLTDPVDEVILGQADYALKNLDYKLVNISRGDVNPATPDEQKDLDEKLKALEKDFEPLKNFIMGILSDKLEDVKPVLNLTNALSCLRERNNGMSVQMENLFRAAGQELPEQKRILELNVSHPVIKKIISAVKNHDDKDKNLNDIAQILYEQALILEGAKLKNPADYVKRVNNLISIAVGE